jgi:hypothetical protein
MINRKENVLMAVHREKINLYKTIKKIFPKILIKDLNENERICPDCHGLGVKINTRVFGTGDSLESHPYRTEALALCPHCFNGVQKICKYCGQPYKGHCDCEGQLAEDLKAQEQKWQEIIPKAKEVDEKDVTTMLYCAETDEYYYTVKAFINDWLTFYSNRRARPIRLWVTSEGKIHIDADEIVLDACSELGEDAEYVCDNDSLQKLLDDWCEEQTATTTYYPCYKEYVVVNWDKYIQER